MVEKDLEIVNIDILSQFLSKDPMKTHLSTSPTGSRAGNTLFTKLGDLIKTF